MDRFSTDLVVRSRPLPDTKLKRASSPPEADEATSKQVKLAAHTGDIHLTEDTTTGPAASGHQSNRSGRRQRARREREKAGREEELKILQADTLNLYITDKQNEARIKRLQEQIRHFETNVIGDRLDLVQINKGHQLLVHNLREKELDYRERAEEWDLEGLVYKLIKIRWQKYWLKRGMFEEGINPNLEWLDLTDKLKDFIRLNKVGARGAAEDFMLNYSTARVKGRLDPTKFLPWRDHLKDYGMLRGAEEDRG